jgi:hypothetical protein
VSWLDRLSTTFALPTGDLDTGVAYRPPRGRLGRNYLSSGPSSIGEATMMTLTSDPQPTADPIGASRESRAARTPQARTGRRMGGDLSNHPASGASRPRHCAAAAGGQATLVCTGVGGESIGRGEQTTPGVKSVSPARFRCPPPDSGVVPFSGKPPSPIKSDSGLPGRVGSSFGTSVPVPSFPSKNLGEERQP